MYSFRPTEGPIGVYIPLEALVLQNPTTTEVHPRMMLLTSSAPPILPTVLPPLPPLVAIERFFAQLLVHRVVCATHPAPEVLLVAQSRGIAGLGHPVAEILSAHPARVEVGKQLEEGAGFLLLSLRRRPWVCRRQRVEEGPRAAAE